MKRAREALRRLYWIDAALRHEDQPTAVGLAEELGVSRDTIYRDLARLREDYGAPVIFDASSRQFRYGHAFRPELPDLPFDDAIALARALRRRLPLTDTALEASLLRTWRETRALLEAAEPAPAAETRSPAPTMPVPRRTRARLGDRVGPTAEAADPIVVRLRFGPAAVAPLLEGGFLRRKDVQLLTDGGIEADVTTRDPDALLLDLLRWAPHFEIASPAWIRRRLPALLRGLLHHWQPKRKPGR